MVSFPNQYEEVEQQVQTTQGMQVELRQQHRQLIEGFSQGSLVFFLTVALTIGSYFLSSKVADAVGDKFMPFGGDLRQLVNKFPVVRPFLSKGVTVVKKILGKVVLVSAYARIAALGVMIFLTLWISNTIVLMSAIYKNCGRIEIGIAMKNALAGAIPSAIITTVALVVLQVLSFIPFVLAASIFLVPIATWSTMLIFNLIFSAGIGQATGVSQGCAAPAPSPAPAPAPA